MTVNFGTVAVATALTIFARLGPTWWENPSRRDAPVAAFLRVLVDRINAAEFENDPEDGADDAACIREFVGHLSEADARSFTLNPDIVLPALEAPSAESRRRAAMPGLNRIGRPVYEVRDASGPSGGDPRVARQGFTVIPGGRC